MGGTQSSTASAETQERLERLYLSVTDFIVRNTDINDMIDIVDPAKCAKYSLYIENIMRRALNTMPLHTVLPSKKDADSTPLTPENNLVYFSSQYIDIVRPDINNMQGDKKTEYCKNVANFFIKIMRIYASIYLSINDTVKIGLINRKVYDASVSEFTLQNPFQDCLMKMYQKPLTTAPQFSFKLEVKTYEIITDALNNWRQSVKENRATVERQKGDKLTMAKQRRDLLMTKTDSSVEFPLCTTKSSTEGAITSSVPNFKLLMGNNVKINNIPGFEEILLLSDSIGNKDIHSKSRQNIVKMFNVFARQMEKTSKGYPTLNVSKSAPNLGADEKIGDKEYNVSPYLSAICSTFSDNSRNIKGNITNDQLTLSSSLANNSALRSIVLKIKTIVDEMTELNKRNRITMQNHLSKVFMTGEDYMKVAAKTKDFPYVCPFNLKQYSPQPISEQGDISRVVESISPLHFVKKGAKKTATNKYLAADFVANPHYSEDINIRKAGLILDTPIDPKDLKAKWAEAKKKLVDGSELICIHTDLVKGGINYLDAVILNVQTDLVNYYINVENKFRQGIALYSQIPNTIR
jgi:hypothetical protein